MILRGFTSQVCVYCATQTAELAPFFSAFHELNVEVFVLYPGPKSKLAGFVQAYRDTFGAGAPPYRLLYDLELELAKGLNVLANLARPTALVLDESGIVRYAYVAESDQNIADRPPAKELFEVVTNLSGAAQ